MTKKVKKSTTTRGNDEPCQSIPFGEPSQPLVCIPGVPVRVPEPPAVFVLVIEAEPHRLSAVQRLRGLLQTLRHWGLKCVKCEEIKS